MTYVSSAATADPIAPIVEMASGAPDGSGFGVVLLNGSGDLLCVSSQGRKLLGKTMGAGATANEAKWLQQVVCRMTATRQMTPDRFDEWITLSSESDRPVAIRLSTLSDEAGAEMTMLLFVDLAAAPKISPSTLRRIFGLTVAEAEVASRIARGETLNRIAREKGVSVPTLRSQLAAVFGKTGTKRQTELALLLARLAILP